MNERVDVHQTKAYGREKVSRQLVWLAAALAIVGAIGVSTSPASSGKTTIAWMIAIAGLALGAFELIVRPSFPGKPLLELSPRGITLRTVGEVFIPWDEIHGVDSIDLKTWPGRTAPFPVTFDNLTVVQIARDFYDRSIIAGATPLPSGAWDHTFLLKGSSVQVAFHHDVLPLEPDDLRREIAARWYAFRKRPPAAAPPVGAVTNVQFRVNWDKT
jgi:hypothetical protein